MAGFRRNAELVIGLVARIGVDVKAAGESIKAELVQYGYSVCDIHITDVMRAFTHKSHIADRPTAERYNSLIDACNLIRAELGDAVMADLAITQINIARKTKPDQPRIAFIVHQIKRPEESERLKEIYGEHYIQVSCHSDQDRRIDCLRDRIHQDHPDRPLDPEWDIQARKLVNRDETEEGVVSGQRVREAFPISDVIVDMNTVPASRVQIDRFFRALFGDKTVTPSREEYGMELANTAAKRSSDGSRQVGAAILSAKAEIKALGCNEVPKPHGGTYWEGDPEDSREFVSGQDSNDRRKRAVVMDLALRLLKVELLSKEITQENLEMKLFEREDDIIKDSQAMDSLEYGRSVHAEMNAITDAARHGHAIGGCLLYSNTFPCHNCAKHILASGISEVVYVHPYPKSYATQLFKHSIELDVLNPSANKIKFRQFVGVMGPMYSRLFTKSKWKSSDGTFKVFAKKDASVIIKTPLTDVQRLERSIIDDLRNGLFEKGYDQAKGPAQPN